MHRSLCTVLLPLLLLAASSVTAQVRNEPWEFQGFSLADSLLYSGDDILYQFDPPRILLIGNARVSYQGRTLESYQITYWQEYDYVEATGTIDSTGAATGNPVFTDTTGDKMYGSVIKYNLNTQEGAVIRGRTTYESGFMAAKTIKLASDDTLYVADGTYTTCDLEEHPHYWFAGDRMKFIVRDKLIIKPIKAYIYGIPVAWFPFYVFPIKQGRQSGFLTPRYGVSRRDGRYMSNMGYYFAINDYTDYRFAGTVRERNGWLLNNWFNYNDRNRITGALYGSFERRGIGGGSNAWKFRGAHRQTISPTLSITGQAQLESGSYSRFNSSNLYERMNREMRSTISIRKEFEESGASLITTLSYNRNLDTENIDSSLPDISYRTSRKSLFPLGETGRTRRMYVKTTESRERRWYHNIYYSFNGRLNNQGSRQNNLETFSREADLSTSLSASQKFMGWLVAEPSLGLQETFTGTNRVAAAERYQRTDNISARMGMSTTVYGMFTPAIGNLVALRHVVNPTVSYSYGARRFVAADDPDAYWRFDQNEADPSRGRANTMSLNLRNIIQAKLREGEEERKLDLFTLNFATNINFEAEKKKISPLQTTLDLRPREGVTTRLTASHSFYGEDGEFNLFNPYMDNLSITTTVRMTPGQLGVLDRSARTDTMIDTGDDDLRAETGAGIAGGSAGTGMRFALNFSHTYGIRRRERPGPDEYNRTHLVKPDLSFSPTQNYSFRYYFNYDIEDGEVTYQQFSMRRTLHCWEANLSWVPAGIQEGYYFKVNIMELPDVKIEQRRGTSRLSY